MIKKLIRWLHKEPETFMEYFITIFMPIAIISLLFYLL